MGNLSSMTKCNFIELECHMNILWYTVLCISTSITTMGAFMVYHACECIPAGRTPWGLMEHYYVLSYDS